MDRRPRASSPGGRTSPGVHALGVDGVAAERTKNPSPWGRGERGPGHRGRRTRCRLMAIDRRWRTESDPVRDDPPAGAGELARSATHDAHLTITSGRDSALIDALGQGGVAALCA